MSEDPRVDPPIVADEPDFLRERIDGVTGD
jgi:hypothetical protein